MRRPLTRTGRLSARSGPQCIATAHGPVIAEASTQIEAAASVIEQHSDATMIVPRLTSGRGLYAAQDLARAHPRVTGLWYGVADLLVDFDDEPPMPYYYDAGESRLAAPAWTRSRLLTITRAAGIALWGQLDLSFVSAPPEEAR